MDTVRSGALHWPDATPARAVIRGDTVTLVIGLTGGIGVGKSTVAAMFAERGAAVVDVDGLGRSVLAPEGGAHDAVVATFGRGILADDGTIDRARLAHAVFGGGDRLAELEAISHPAINELLVQEIEAAAASGTGPVVLDMAVLTESQLGRVGESTVYHRVVVVEASIDVRIPRLIERGMTEDDARGRMAAQASDLERRRIADLIVPNSGSLDQLADHLGVLWPTVEAWRTQQPGGAT